MCDFKDCGVVGIPAQIRKIKNTPQNPVEKEKINTTNTDNYATRCQKLAYYKELKDPR